MLLFAFFVSTSFPVGAAITHGLDPAALTFVRFLTALTVFAAVLVVQRERSLPSARALVRYSWLAFLLVVFFVTMFEGLRYASALSTSAIFTLLPLMTAAIAFFVVGQRTGVAVWIGLLVAAAGAVWVLFDGDWHKLISLSLGWGEAIFFVGCVSYSAYSPFVRRLHSGERLSVLTFWTLVLGAFLLALYGGRAIVATDWLSVEPRVYLGIIYLGTFNTALTFYLIQYGSMRLPSAQVMAYTLLVPAFVVLVEGVLSGTWPQAPVFAGIAVTCAAMVFLQWVGARGIQD